jgi:hypothetical protein
LRYIWANRKSKKEEEGRRKKEGGRRKKEEGGRRKKEEGRRKRKKEGGRSYLLVATNSHAQLPIKNYAASF